MLRNMVSKKRKSKKRTKKVDSWKDFFVKYRTDIIVLVFLIFFFITLNYFVYSPLKQLPSPIYGGDYYYQLGCTNHVRYGGNPFENCNLISDNPGYFPLYSILSGYVARLLGVDSIKSEIYLSYILYILSIIISYILLKLITKNILVSVVGVLLFLRSSVLIVKYTDFSAYVVSPLLILIMYLFWRKESYFNALLLAVVLGMASLSHSTLFVSGFIYVFALIFYKYNNYELFKINFKSFKEKLQSNFFKVLFLFLISFLVSLLYWYEPIFIHHGKTALHYLEWNGPGDFSKMSLQLHIAKQVIVGTFFNFHNFYGAVISLIMITSLVLSVLFKRRSLEKYFVDISLLVLFLIIFSYFITYPLFGIHFVPNYVYYVFGSIILISYISYYLAFIYSLLVYKFDKKIISLLFIILILFLLAAKVRSVNDYTKFNKWYKVGVTGLDDAKISLRNYIINNTDVNDVFLTTKELGFMLNSLTGRKLVTGRWAQNDPFENMWVRDMDAAVILYGNNTKVKLELIKKYNVKYLYWDYYWYQSEYYFDKNGKIISWFDPLISFYNKSIEEYLQSNNVKYFIYNSYVDPALRSEFHPTFDLIFISPENYYNFTHPWNPNLDRYLKMVWSYEYKGRTIAKLYKINV